MYTFLVLGFIPGTSIQITFLIWQYAIIAVFEIICLLWLLRRHPFHIKLTSRIIYSLIASYTSARDSLRLALKHAPIVPIQEDEVSA
jgi:hypothetical protein